MSPRPTIPLDEITENEWQKNVIDLAHLFGWQVAHFRPAQTTKGWRTPVAADGAGWPDLVLVRDRILAVELKREKGKVAAAQQEWLDALQAAGAEVHVWKPSDLEQVAETLRRRENTSQFPRPRMSEIGRSHVTLPLRGGEIP